MQKLNVPDVRTISNKGKPKTLQFKSLLYSMNNSDCSCFVPEINMFFKGEYSVPSGLNSMIRNCIVVGTDLTTHKQSMFILE
jgi:hypothetical protein